MRFEIYDYLPSQYENAITIALRKYNKIKYPTFNSNKYIFAYDGKKLIGYAEVKQLNFAITELRHVFIFPPYRNHGYGKQLFAKQIENANTPIIIFTTNISNIAMQKIGKSFGFRNIAIFHNEKTNRDIVFYLKKGGE